MSEQYVWLVVDGNGNIIEDWLPMGKRPNPQHRPYQRFRVIPDPEPEPEPEIAKCKCGRDAHVEVRGGGLCFARCYDGMCWSGPPRSTRIEAINAWNEVMGKKEHAQ